MNYWNKVTNLSSLKKSNDFFAKFKKKTIQIYLFTHTYIYVFFGTIENILKFLTTDCKFRKNELSRHLRGYLNVL